MAMPQKPDTNKTRSLDDLVSKVGEERNNATGVPIPAPTPAAAPTPKAKPEPKPIQEPVIEENVEARTDIVPPSGTGGLIGNGEILKQTQFNLPISLNERIATIANAFHAGNKSHFVRAALEKEVSRLEKVLASQI